ncbi:MAG TPA: hypothetical protein VM802_29390 [Chitinophaga sp.]|uniref:hypothetical protein n=1 Tax=Chitinophaga sp. TaxID=1869181 RepID=UPI002CCCD0D3|nr:hypothetical protein [Chitinophaga sp.]HVI49016.1 hypothetical protein [Chitinophaga sp.]
MINLHHLKSGDTVLTKYAGVDRTGQVLQVDHEDKKALVLTDDDNEFWFDLDNLYPIHLDEQALLKLQFHKDEAQSGNSRGMLYVRGPFSVRFYGENNDPRLVLNYRDETRALKENITLNELQNHYHQMTNFHLE